MTATDLDELVEHLANGGTNADARALAKSGAALVPHVMPYVTTGWRAEITPLTMLRMLRGVEVVEQLGAFARTEESAIADAAIEALGHTKSKAALPILLDCLAVRGGREVIARALGALGMSEAIGALEAEWQRCDLDQLFAKAGNGMGALWDLAALGGALLRLGSTGYEEPLSRIVRSEDTTGGVEAIEGLRWSGVRLAVDCIARAMSDPRSELADAAVDAFGAIGLPAVAARLITLTHARPDRLSAVRLSLRGLFGDGVPERDLDAWWASCTWPLDRHLWWGGQDPGHAISKLPTSDGGLARTRLELWTGVDMVDSADRGTQGDQSDMLRASLWWQRVAWDWRTDVIYRNRRQLDIAPILEAVTSEDHRIRK